VACFADLEVNNSVNNSTGPYIGRLSVLRQWNTRDPPNAYEKRRNQVIYDVYQHNRNPFIDPRMGRRDLELIGAPVVW
jgi:endonuclease I